MSQHAQRTTSEYLHRWQAVLSTVTTRTEQLSLRERVILTLMLAALIMVVFQLLWSARIDAEHHLLRQQLEQANSRNQALWAQAEAVRQAHMNDPNDALRARLTELSTQLGNAEEKLSIASYELMQPQNIPLLLQNLVSKQPGLTLRRVETLPTVMVDINGKVISDPKAIEDGVLFRHGMEVEIAGSFPTLNRWLLAIEKVPGFIRWESMEYTVEPASTAGDARQARLVLRLFTLSVQENWLHE